MVMMPPFNVLALAFAKGESQVGWDGMGTDAPKERGGVGGVVETCVWTALMVMMPPSKVLALAFAKGENQVSRRAGRPRSL